MNWNINDWELVEVARKDDPDAFEEIMTRYAPLLNRIQADFYLPEMDLDEWVQEARIVLWRTIEHFDTFRQEAFGSYFKTALLNRRRDLARRAHAKKRNLVQGRLEIDADQEYSSNLLVDHSRALPDDVAAVHDIIEHCMATEFSKFERKVHLFASSNMDLEEIACQLNVELIQVKNAMERIKKKLRREFAVGAAVAD